MRDRAAREARSLLFRTLTYNIHRGIGVDRRFRPERIVEILHHYDAQIVLLQEVDEGVPRSRELDMPRELARQLGYPYFAFGHNVSLRKGRYGNATLSRFPILRERNIDLSLPGRWIRRRGCQHTRIEVARARPPLEVFNLHLGLGARERRVQIELLARSGELAALSWTVPCLIAGDFNDWRSLLRPMLSNGLGFRCAIDARAGTGRPLLTYPSFSPQGGLDRIYYRGPLRLLSVRRCRLEVARIASDHLPVIAEFQLL
jgi:endonuclease/exonuclease/phosphatase family metal-dependent hydrolase